MTFILTMLLKVIISVIIIYQIIVHLLRSQVQDVDTSTSSTIFIPVSVNHIDQRADYRVHDSNSSQQRSLPRNRHINQHRHHRSLSPSIGTNIRALLLLVQFPEHDNSTIPLPSREYFHTMCNTYFIPYLQQQSYNQYNITACDVMDWMKTDYSQEFYSNSLSNIVGSEFASAFFIPVLQQLDDDKIISDWSVYDTADLDGTIDTIIVLHSGYGAEFRNIGDCNISDYEYRIHSQGHNDSSGDWYDETIDGYRPWTNIDQTISLSGYAIASVYDFICTNTPATPGVILHEWIHIFGAPDLYGSIVDEAINNSDTTATTTLQMDSSHVRVRGIGSYDIMSNARGPLVDGYPSSLSVYTKYVIGWMQPKEIMYDGTYVLEPSYLDHTNAFIIRHPKFAVNEYLLIEYRSTLLIVDQDLFGGGLLIYHVDDNQRSQGASTVPFDMKTVDGHYKVALLQADGLYDIELGNNNGDTNDYWIGGMILEPSGRNTTKDTLLYPNTDSYYNGPTGLTIFVLNITTSTSTTQYATILIQGIGISDTNNNNTTVFPTMSSPIATSPSYVPSYRPSINAQSIYPSNIHSDVPSNIPVTTPTNFQTSTTLQPLRDTPKAVPANAIHNTAKSNDTTNDMNTKDDSARSASCARSIFMKHYFLIQGMCIMSIGSILFSR